MFRVSASNKYGAGKPEELSLTVTSRSPHGKIAHTFIAWFNAIGLSRLLFASGHEVPSMHLCANVADYRCAERTCQRARQ